MNRGTSCCLRQASTFSTRISTGLIDDVRLYDHMLAPAELQSLANQLWGRYLV